MREKEGAERGEKWREIEKDHIEIKGRKREVGKGG